MGNDFKHPDVNWIEYHEQTADIADAARLGLVRLLSGRHRPEPPRTLELPRFAHLTF